MLVALVDSHTSGVERHKEKLRRRTEGLDKSQVDLVPGKGQGLIILLHGPPGSGKTSTAETIAAYTGRPLYSITCGDIGLVPKDVEKELDEHTSRADKWGCVLLLDEADVFLMQRTWKELARNALVSGRLGVNIVLPIRMRFSLGGPKANKLLLLQYSYASWNTTQASFS